MSMPSIPSNFTINHNMDASVDMDTSLSGGVTMMLAGDQNNPVTTQMGAEIKIRNFPELSLQDIHGLIRTLKETKMRMRMPVNLSIGASVFPLNLWGIDLFRINLCGEPQIIIDEYKPNAFERCEVDCDCR